MRRLATLAAVLLGLVLWPVGPAGAQDGGWTITRFDAVLDVDPAGDVTVTETIAVDFGGLERRGIFRTLPVRYPVGPDVDLPDGGADEWWRALDVDGVRVSSATAPDDTDVTRPGVTGTDLSIRIGDPDGTITGAHEYRIRYRVRGALDAVDGVPELYWNVTGNGWPVPIEAATATVRAPGIVDVVCFAGVVGAASPCTGADAAGSRATFLADGLDAGEGLTVAVRFEPGAVDVPAPLLRRRWTLAGAFLGSRWAVPLAVVVMLSVAAALAVLTFREGRDRVSRGGVDVAGRVERDATGERRRGLLEPRPVPVEFRPPEGLRPGQVGLLVDERVDPLDVSATIVDLAVRGHLTIEEVEERRRLWGSRTDWILRRATGDVDDPAPGGVLAYEQRLLAGLFESGDEVRVSELKGPFAPHYQLAEKALYQDGASRGWFNGRPDAVRTRWLVFGVLATAAGIVVTFVLARYTRVAIAGLPLVLGGLALAVGHRWMPHRTGRGSALLTRSLGFREFIATADAERIRFADAEGSFLRYLPYAVVFGEVDRWAKAFAELGVDLAAGVGSWYVGHTAFDAARFSSGLSDFSAATSTAVATVPSSSGGSGFGGGGSSGGGFGGGGGGSW